MELSKTPTVMQLGGSIGASGFEIRNVSPTQMSYKHESGSLMYLSQQVAAKTVVFFVQNVNSHFSIEHFFFYFVCESLVFHQDSMAILYSLDL